MHVNRSSIRALMTMGIIAFGACGDSTDVGVDLTEQEATALAGAVLQSAVLASNNVPGGPAPVGGPQAAPVAFDGEVSFTAACPLGGSVAVDGSVDFQGDNETGQGRLELAVSHEHNGCVVESDGGLVFTLDGSPRVTLGLVLENDGLGQLVWTGSLAGVIDWANEGREGTCAIDLDFAGAASDVEDSIAFGVEGTVCRTAVTHSWSLGVG